MNRPFYPYELSKEKVWSLDQIASYPEIEPLCADFEDPWAARTLLRKILVRDDAGLKGIDPERLKEVREIISTGLQIFRPLKVCFLESEFAAIHSSNPISLGAWRKKILEVHVRDWDTIADNMGPQGWEAFIEHGRRIMPKEKG